MDKKIIFLIGFLIIMVWSVGGLCTGGQPAPAQPAAPPMAAAEPATINPSDPEAFQGRPRLYTGIIKNKSNCNVSLYSGNSDAALTIPAHSWIEYDAWLRHFDLTAYCDGKPFYCLNINADPKAYPFMCKNYDFMVEIVKPEGVQRYPGKKFKRRVKKVKALG